MSSDISLNGNLKKENSPSVNLLFSMYPQLPVPLSLKRNKNINLLVVVKYNCSQIAGEFRLVISLTSSVNLTFLTLSFLISKVGIILCLPHPIV